MKMLLPKDILTWLDKHRGKDSRQVYIIKILHEVINSKHSNTYGAIDGNTDTRQIGTD